jgi:uncharacterized membrane protein HdeD (DUF308 family)
LSRGDLSWKMLLIALVLVILGILLMFESSSMLFEMNPLSIIVMTLAALFIFSGIALIVIAVAAIASI